MLRGKIFKRRFSSNLNFSILLSEKKIEDQLVKNIGNKFVKTTIYVFES